MAKTARLFFVALIIHLSGSAMAQEIAEIPDNSTPVAAEQTPGEQDGNSFWSQFMDKNDNHLDLSEFLIENAYGFLPVPLIITEPAVDNGLGLAGVWGCALNHRGVVEVTSGRGTGTTFRLLVPLSRAESRRPFLDVGREHIRGTGRILLVDDEEGVRHAAGQALRKLGYEVTTAVDGVEGVETFAKAGGRFALVILDMIMPQLSGPEAFRKMRRLHPETPILLSTGYSESDTGTILIREGAAGLLQKPYEIDELSIEVARHISGRPKEPSKVPTGPIEPGQLPFFSTSAVRQGRYSFTQLRSVCPSRSGSVKYACEEAMRPCPAKARSSVSRACS